MNYKLPAKSVNRVTLSIAIVAIMCFVTTIIVALYLPWKDIFAQSSNAYAIVYPVSAAGAGHLVILKASMTPYVRRKLRSWTSKYGIWINIGFLLLGTLLSRFLSALHIHPSFRISYSQA